MSRGKRIDDNTRAELIKEKINTGKDTSDIAKDLGINDRTAQNIINKELADVCGKSTRVAKIIDDNDTLVSLCDVELIKRIKTKPEELRPLELNTIKDSSFKQNQLLTGGATESIKITKEDCENMSDDELEKLANGG